MSRRRRAAKRAILPDPKYNDVIAAKFINALMRGGKKSTAESILYKALDSIEQRSGYNDSKRVFHDAIERVSPHLEVRSRRIGGATYQIPVEVRSERSQALAIRWLIETARKRNEPTMSQRLSRELIDAASSQGAAVKKRDDTHKMAEANRAFSHYRW